jgi:hypothetical protein
MNRVTKEESAKKPNATVKKSAVISAKAEEVVATKTKAATSAKTEKPTKPAKPKMVRDSFTMPEEDYFKLDALKALCLENGIEIKKSELLRAGLIALSALAVADLLKAVSLVEKIKTGRPKGK